jgi:ABC-type branched-subunit amino acid transport system substrate-binding protein
MRTAVAGLAASCILLCLQPSVAQDSLKIGFSVPLTGAFAENGKQMLAAAKLFMEQKGHAVSQT